MVDEKHVLANNETGGSYPTKIAKQIFESIYKNKKAPEFTKPVSVLTRNIDEYMLKKK